MTTRPQTASRLALEILLLAAAYALVGWLVRLPGQAPSPLYASIIWPSAGLALGVLLARGWRLWPGVWLGAFLIDSSHLLDAHATGPALAAAAMIATGVTIQALLGRVLLYRSSGSSLGLDAPSSILRFIVLCAILASLASASVGVATLSIFGLKSTDAVLMEWVQWWSGDVMGVVLGTPVVLALFARSRETWRGRGLRVALPLLFAIVVLTGVFAVISRLESDNRQAEFERDAALQIGNVVQTALNEVEEASNSMADLFRADEWVSPSEFAAFVSGIHQRHPAIHAMGWIPRVGRQELGAHEQAMRSGGFPAYSVFERSADGGRTPVTARGEYFPLQFVIPQAQNAAAFGFDHASEPLRRSVLERARQNGRLVASERIRLIHEDGKPFGVLVAVPFFRAPSAAGDDGLAGYTMTVIRVGQLLDTVLRPSFARDIAYRLVDLDAGGDNRLLHESGKLESAPLYRFTNAVRFGERRWELSVTAGEGYRFIHYAWYAWVMLFSGVLVCILLCSFVLIMSGRAMRTERLVTERTAELEAARAEAEKSAQLLREAVGSIAQGFTIYDQQDRLVLCNEAYKGFYEASRDLIVPGATFEQIVRRGAERGQYAAAIGQIDDWVADRVAQHQSANGTVIEQRLGDGRWLLIVEHRTPSGYIAGNRIDITALKRSEADLMDRNAQLGILFQLIPDGLVLFDREGLATFANPAFLRMTGLLAGEIVDRPLGALERRLREQAEEQERWAGLEACFIPRQAGIGGTNTPATTQRDLLVLKRPREVVLELVGVASTAASVSRLLYARDVTHEIEVDRMKSEFLSHAAHELRTPMASIFGFTELLIAQEFDDATRKDLLTTIHTQTAWLVDIINELLDLARIESRRGKDFNIEAVPLEPLVREVTTAMQIDEARWPLSVECAGGMPPVRADAAKLRQALTNVLGNAVKYSPKGGLVEIRCVTETREGKHFVGIVVSDHGVGMTSAQLARVGERFYRADTSGNIPGTGLGVTIVKEIVELHGGSLDVDSTPGAGTTITLWLPAALADSDRSAASTSPFTSKESVT
jgi:signal transduction histidine kinase/CHASE1-domain containing sensor protein